MTRRISLHTTLVSLFAAVLFLSLAPIGAQAPQAGDHAAHLKAWDAHKTLAQASPYKAMNWSYIGPTNISGRVTDVAAADHGSARRLYAGSCCGGVWASDDLGQTWQPIFDKEASTSTGALAVAPSNPDILWIGTGESNIFRQLVHRRRRLQVDRQREDVSAHGPDRHRHHRPHRHSSNRCEHRVRRVGRPGVDGKRDARRLQDDRRRPHVDAGAEDQSENRCERPRNGSEGSQHALCRGVAAPAPQVERPARRTGLRREPHLQDDRRRQDMDEAHERSARIERVRADRRCGGGIESQRRVCVLRQL